MTPRARFYRAATSYLSEHWRSAIHRVTGGDIVGRWHPNGFVVFRLGDVPLGRLRLHIWPAGGRRGLEGHPPIHCHDWDLASRVLSGTYREATARPDDLGGDGEISAVYHVEYLANGDDNVEETDVFAQVALGPVCHFHEGTTHYVDAGVFHVTSIPDDERLVTLVIMSEPRIDEETILLGPPGFGSRASRRPELSSSEARALRQQLSGLLERPTEQRAGARRSAIE